MKSHTFGNMVILSDKSSSRNGVIVNRCYKVMSLLKFLCHSLPCIGWEDGGLKCIYASFPRLSRSLPDTG